MDHMFKKFIAICVLFAGINSFADSQNTEHFVQSVSDRVIGVINDPSLDDSQKTAKLKTMFIDIVDIQWMAKFALGKNWRTISDAQKQEFISSYQDFLLGSYLPIFKKYTGEKIEILKSETIAENQFKVYTKIDRVNQEDVNVDYVLHLVNGKL
jgi:phospholipid transport system substrate-binding protein